MTFDSPPPKIFPRRGNEEDIKDQIVQKVKQFIQKYVKQWQWETDPKINKQMTENKIDFLC